MTDPLTTPRRGIACPARGVVRLPGINRGNHHETETASTPLAGCAARHRPAKGDPAARRTLGRGQACTRADRQGTAGSREALVTHTYFHARSSARIWGGEPEDYLAVHDWMDATKKVYCDFRHRALRHHSEGIFVGEEVFGATVTNSVDKRVPVRYILEQHCIEDSGIIPTVQDWFRDMPFKDWMFAPDGKAIYAWTHAEASAEAWGGEPEDYLPVHDWFDETQAGLRRSAPQGVAPPRRGHLLLRRADSARRSVNAGRRQGAGPRDRRGACQAQLRPNPGRGGLPEADSAAGLDGPRHEDPSQRERRTRREEGRMSNDTAIRGRLDTLPPKVGRPVARPDAHRAAQGPAPWETVLDAVDLAGEPQHLLGFAVGMLDMGGDGVPMEDTVRMARELGHRLNLRWSPRRWKEEHDRLSRRMDPQAPAVGQTSPTTCDATRRICPGAGRAT